MEPNANDEISLKDLILKLGEWYRYLLGRWLIIVTAGIFGGALGFAYAYYKKPIYTAETTFVLEEGEGGGGLSSYAGIASMMGINLNAGGGGVFEGDNILQLYKSRKMIQTTLLSIDTFETKPELLIDRYVASNKLRDVWEKNPKTKGIRFDIPPDRFTLQHDSIITQIVGIINQKYLSVKKPDDKLSILKVQVKSEDELFAKSFANKIVETVNQFYVSTKTKKSAQNLGILQQQADSVRRVLNYNIGGVATAIDANPNSNPAFQALKVPSQRKQIDVQASGAVYQEIVKNLEISKISLRKETPLIQVIDMPILPLHKEKLGKIKGMILGGLVFGFLTIIFLLIRKALTGVS